MFLVKIEMIHQETISDFASVFLPLPDDYLKIQEKKEFKITFDIMISLVLNGNNLLVSRKEYELCVI
jgi:hypothetical protein